MRRSAINLTVPALCAMLAVVLVSTIGRADDARPAPKLNPRPKLTFADRPLVRLSQDKRAELLYDSSRAVRSKPLVMEVTAYCPCNKCCGPDAQGITASGRRVSHNGGRFVAADTKVLPFGTRLIIPGYADEKRVEVVDRGGAIKGNRLDVFFPTHAEALKWGRQKVEVFVVE
jgi:3D (Asp-Asp-Asp) domain-containing protein